MVLHDEIMTLKVLVKEAGVDRNAPFQRELREKFLKVEDHEKY